MHLHEPLAESAALACRLADELCAGSGHDCAWYHGIWQYLRLFNVITSISSDSDFLLRSFHDLAAQRGRYRRILISGTADYAMLAHLLAAYGDAGDAPQITVLDVCRTPLELNRWYAERCGVEIETCQGDILEFSPGVGFDLVCAHSFLGFFAGDSRGMVVGKWQALLREGGKIITSQRIRPGHAEADVRYRAEEILRLAEKTRDIAAAAKDLHGITPERLVEGAASYARNKGGYPVRSEHELIALFAANGLLADRVEAAGGESRRSDRPAGPRDSRSYRLRIIATRA